MPHGSRFASGLRSGQKSASESAFQLRFFSVLPLKGELTRPPEERSNAAGLLQTDATLAKVPLTVLSFCDYVGMGLPRYLLGRGFDLRCRCLLRRSATIVEPFSNQLVIGGFASVRAPFAAVEIAA